MKGALLPYLSLKKLIYIGLLTFSSWAVAQNIPEDSKLTLSSAIKLTLRENPSLKVFTFRQYAIEGQQQIDNLKPAYNIGFEMEDFAGTGNLSAIQSTEFTVSLSSIIEMGDKRAASISVTKNHNSVLEAERKIESLKLLGEVTRRYIDVLTAQERLALAKEATQLAEATLFEVKKRSNAGIAPEAEVKRAMAAVASTKLITSSEQQQFDYSKVALAMMWNENAPKFSKVNGNLFHFTKDIEFNNLFAKVKQNPEILVFATEEKLKEAQLHLTRTQSRADIKWSIGIRQNAGINDTALTAGFSMPLFTSKRNIGAIISAKAARDEVAVRKEITMQKLRQQLYRAYTSRKQAIFTAQTLKDNIIPTLTEALEQTQTAYQRGRYSYLDYLTARQELLYARRALIESAASALHYGVDIEQLIAEPLSASQHSLVNEIQGITP